MGLLVAWYLAFRSLRDKIKTENIDSELAASDGVDYMEEEAALLCSSQVTRHYLSLHSRISPCVTLVFIYPCIKTDSLSLSLSAQVYVVLRCDACMQGDAVGGS